MKKYFIIALSAVVVFSGLITAGADSQSDEVAATVNGAAIYESQVQRMLAPQMQQISAQAQQLPPEFIEQYVAQIRNQILDQLVTEQLMEQQVEQENIEATLEEAEQQLVELGSMQQPPLTLDDIKGLITASGESYENVLADMRQRIRYTKLLEQQWQGKDEVSQEQAQQYYQENEEQFIVPQQVQASHILITPDQSAEDAEAAQSQARQQAQGLLEQINDGADFAELAMEHSECPSGAQGGDLGFFGAGQMVPEFEQAAFALEPGQTSDIVETQFGYHIIQVTEKSEAAVTSFEDAKPQLMEMLKQQKQAEIAETYIMELKEQAEIVYADADAD